MPTEPLWCKIGQHTWEREVTRGRKPIACPEHREAEVAAMPAVVLNEVLQCAAGHQWARRGGQRGRKPQYCPAHAPTPPKPAESRTVAPSPPPDLSESQPSDLARRVCAPEPESDIQHLWCELGDHSWERPVAKGKRPKNCPEHRPAASTSRPTNIVGLDVLLTQYYIDPESERVLRHIEEAVSAPDWPAWREPEDVRILMAAYDGRLRYVRRGSRLAA